MDGFTVTHSVERVDVLEDAVAKAFVGEYEPENWALKPGTSMTFGDLDADDYYFEHKRQQIEAMEHVTATTEDVLARFAEVSGRKYGIVESYRLDDADIAIVILGSTEGVVRAAIDDARAAGIKVGLLRIRLFRPFPVETVRAALKDKQIVGVFDRAVAFGAPGNALFQDVALSTRTGADQPPVVDFVYGLGGRVTPKKLARQAIDQLASMASSGVLQDSPIYLGLRE
jgi:pyruvate ferredoxin oxidoreductase alpha subunit